MATSREVHLLLHPRRTRNRVLFLRRAASFLVRSRQQLDRFAAMYSLMLTTFISFESG